MSRSFSRSAANVAAVPASRRSTDPIERGRENLVDHKIPKPDLAMCMTSIIRVRQIVEGRVEEALAPFELNFMDYHALTTLHLSHDGSRPIGRVAWGLMAHPATITSVIDRLAKRGLVERPRHPTDRRLRLAAITEKGRNVAHDAMNAVVAADWGLAGVARSDMRALTELLTSIRRAAGDIPEGE